MTVPYPHPPDPVFLVDPATGLGYAATGVAGGPAVTEADGANVALGAKADAAAQSGTASVIALLKGLMKGFSFAHISTNTSTTVKASAGVLHQISVNKAGATANIATVYDGADTSGVVVAVIDTTVTGTRGFDAIFGTGLFIVTATGTAGDLTVTYC